ncbi:hypothetical protein EXU57_09360 [Segetibacter sp. 3557_3]|nr:hypothetical protein EXU57_09360 [Segetibacter sp. 3557_3]
MLRLSIILIVAFIGSGFLVAYSGNTYNGKAYPERLSEWQIFDANMASLMPKPGVVPFDLNTPLFSDYAEKARFIRLPRGTSVEYTSSGILAFPTGALLIKTFYYSADLRKPGQNKQLIETRLLLKEAAEWKALTYVWNEEQTDAFLEIAGEDRLVRFVNSDGEAKELRYVIPNQNQCKGCHNVNEMLLPIGPTAAQLNRNYLYQSGVQNQLRYWKLKGMLNGLPELRTVSKTPVWNDPASGDLESRARAYLAINCAHCHSPQGPARTSGLYLTETETNKTALGIHKSPVAAGKGSGGRLVDILPGSADSSILWYRMQAEGAGERMPELGKSLVHKEGVALIRDWINNMK